MELCGSYDFCQLLHVHWFDVDNVFITVRMTIFKELNLDTY
jgi:hypothetical protein